MAWSPSRLECRPVLSAREFQAAKEFPSCRNQLDPAPGINSWLEDELYHQYQFDRNSVDEGWIGPVPTASPKWRGNRHREWR